MKGQASFEYVFLLIISLTLGSMLYKEFKKNFIDSENSFIKIMLSVSPYQEDQNFENFKMMFIDDQ